MSITLALNPNLDPEPYARIFARDGIVRMDNVLLPDAAAAVARLLEQHTPWKLTLSNDPDELKAGLYDAARIKAVGEAALAVEVAGVNQRARDGFAYLYLSYPMLKAYLEGWDPGHPIHALTEMINSPGLLALLRAVTGRPDVIKADAQATLYRPGDFLTLHDDGQGEGRVCAYTFGFTRTWRPDWGGQLLFHDESLEIERGLSPGFNCLTLFKTPRWHSVAPVAPYAGAPRLSIVGWARTDLKV